MSSQDNFIFLAQKYKDITLHHSNINLDTEKNTHT